MSFLGFANMVDSRQNPAAVIPIWDDDDDDDDEDDDGYTTANDSFTSEADDVRERACSPECPPLRRISKRLSRKDGEKNYHHVKVLFPALTEPLRFERKGPNVGIVSTLLELLKGCRLGSDVTKLQLPPQFNLPKSQLQAYGEAVYCCAQDYLGMCADGASPVERLLAVVRFHLSTTRPTPFLKAPYNPVLGETHHISAGNLHVICEQVSHHPPVSALYATNEAKQLEMLWWHQPLPRFYGGYVEASISGQRQLKLLQHQETYEFTSPNLQVRFLPNAGSAWVGATTVKCKETGLEAVVNFKARPFFGMRGSSNKVSGKVFQRSSPRDVLYELNGSWDGVVSLNDKATGVTSTLYDAQASIVDIHAPTVANLEAVSPLESVCVWSEVTMSMLSGDWENAHNAKRKVEETQRALHKQRLASSTVWSPKYFTATKDGTWEWQRAGESVPSAPLVVE